jgi:hypothetical protein
MMAAPAQAQRTGFKGYRGTNQCRGDRGAAAHAGKELTVIFSSSTRRGYTYNLGAGLEIKLPTALMVKLLWAAEFKEGEGYIDLGFPVPVAVPTIEDDCLRSG